MKYLNLDSQFAPFGEGISFESFLFKGGEPHIKILEALTEEDEVMITCRASDFAVFGMMLLAADALRRFGIKRMELFIPYFPAARQDRVMIPGEPLSVKVYADMVNAMNFDKVLIFDAHSEVTPALVNNAVVIPNHALVKKVLENRSLDDLILVSPDGGALKKIYKLSQALGGVQVVEASKKRDVKTGKLSSFHVYEDDLEGKTCVVVDDICDGGGTFLGLAEQLKLKGAGEMVIIVSHGIFSKGVDHLLPIYTEIYCSDSFSSRRDQGLRQIQLNQETLTII